MAASPRRASMGAVSPKNKLITPMLKPRRHSKLNDISESWSSVHEEELMTMNDGLSTLRQSTLKFDRTETFDCDNVDLRGFRVLPELQALGETVNSSSVSTSLAEALRLVLNVAALCSIVSLAVTSAPDASTIAISRESLNGLAIVAQFAPVPICGISILAMNNYFSRYQFYKFLAHGTIVDFESSSKSTFHRRFSLAMLVYFCVYIMFLIVVFFILRASLLHFVVVSACVGGIYSFWRQEQTACKRMLSLDQYVAAFSSTKEKRMNNDSLLEAAKHLPRMMLLTTHSPSFSNYWRKFFFRSSTATGRLRFLVNLALVSFVFLCMGAILVYVGLTHSVAQDNTWIILNRCVEACVKDYSRGAMINSSRCAPCVCSCAKSFQRSLKSCSSQLSVLNCTIDACICS
jgi:hypothetical protein